MILETSFQANSFKTILGGMVRISVWDQLSKLVMTVQRYCLSPFLKLKGKLLAASVEKSEIDQWASWFLDKIVILKYSD